MATVKQDVLDDLFLSSERNNIGGSNNNGIVNIRVCQVESRVMEAEQLAGNRFREVHECERRPFCFRNRLFSKLSLSTGS